MQGEPLHWSLGRQRQPSVSLAQGQCDSIAHTHLVTGPLSLPTSLLSHGLLSFAAQLNDYEEETPAVHHELCISTTSPAVLSVHARSNSSGCTVSLLRERSVGSQYALGSMLTLQKRRRVL